MTTHQTKRRPDAITPNVKEIVGDEIKILLANEEDTLGIVSSGDASKIIGGV